MEVVQVIILLTLVFSALGQMPSSGSVGHKYDLEIQKVELMNKTDFVEFQGLKVKRLNKTCEFNGCKFVKIVVQRIKFFKFYFNSLCRRWKVFNEQ